MSKCVICGNEIPEGRLICPNCYYKYSKKSKKTEIKKDEVNHPSHYGTGKFECIDVMQEVYGVEDVKAFCLCNAFKYLYRAKRKENQKQDIEKAIWYLQRWLKLSD